MTAALLLLVGIACLAAAALAWSGRWRAWSRRFPLGPLAVPITIVPGVGFAAIGAALYELSGQSVVTALCFAALVAGLVLNFWAPEWFGPRWLRRERARDPGPDLADPGTAASYVALTPRARASERQAREAFGDGEPVERWRATWVQDEGATERPHALARPGATQGRLELHPDGLAFSALDVEDRLRGHTTGALVSREDFRGARVVPRGAGPDGRARDGSGPRSAFPRLVVDTAAGPYVFEVNFAKRKARRIQETLTA
jgi:hypothetical protein